MLAPVVDWALTEINLNCKFELIENPIILSKMGITVTPTMMINGEIVLQGRVPSAIEMVNILEKTFKQANPE